MASLNKWLGIGNLGSDPESRFTPSGDCVCTIRIACTESWKDKSGEKKERTEWVTVVLWRKLGEIASEYLKKGMQVYVEGKMQTEEYEKDGIKRYSTKIVADTMKMLGGKQQGGDQSSSAQQSRPAQSSGKPPAGSFDDMDDGIPF